MANYTDTEGLNFFFDANGEDDVVYGLDGADSLIGEAGDDYLDGGVDDDYLVGGAGNDTLVGGEGNDTALYSWASGGVNVDLGNAAPQDTGGAGVDTLSGIEALAGSTYNDVLTGNDLANLISGDAGDDVINGAGGDDMLQGDAGNDTFVFSFTKTTGGGAAETFSGWLADQGLTVEDGVSQGFFASKYTAWLEHLAKEYGLGDGTVEINQNSQDGVPQIEGLSSEELAEMFGDREDIVVQTGKKTHVRWYSDSFTVDGGGEPSVTSGDGDDTVSDFVWGVDKLELDGLEGLSLDEFKQFFDVTDDGSNTQLSLADGSWSVLLPGVTGYDEDGFYSDAVVV